MRLRPDLCSISTVGLLSIASLLSNTAWPQEQNLARGSRVSWSPAPNYARCTDEDDARQLVDGRRLHRDRGWTDRDMVGWARPAGSRVQITLDLGRRGLVDKVVLSTRFAADSEVLPPSAVLAVGSSNTSLRWAAAVDSRHFHDEADDGARRIELQLQPEHALSARWVHLVLTLQEDFLFLDEIEVWGSPEVPAETLAATAVDSTAIMRPTQRDGDRMAAQQRRLWAIRRALPFSLPTSQCFPFVAVDSEEHSLLLQRAVRWRAMTPDTLSWFGVRQVDPFAWRDGWSAPGPPLRDTLHVAVGEWGVAAFDVWWAGREPRQIHPRVESHAASGLSVTLRHAVSIEARDETWVDDALPRLRAPLTLHPGRSTQIWLDVDARHAVPGLHLLRIRINDREVSFPVQVSPAAQPPVPPLATANFTYPNRRAFLRAHPLAAIHDNTASGINSWILDADAVPWPRRSDIQADGSRIRPLDFSACDRELSQLATTDTVLQVGWYWNFWMEHDDPSGGRFHHPYFSEAWKRAVSQWLDEWMTHLQQHGLSRDRVFMQPVDERGGRRVEELLRFLKRSAPDVRLALTLAAGQSEGDLEALLPWLDLAILNRDVIRRHSGFVDALQQRGGEVWMYAVLNPARSTSPTAGYRLLPWQAWAQGLQGCAFWSYAHVAGDSWDDFDGDHADFAVVYANRDSATSDLEPFVPSKRWRAFRLGIQDVGRFATAQRRQPQLRADVLAAVDDRSRRADVLRRSFP